MSFCKISRRGKLKGAFLFGTKPPFLQYELRTINEVYPERSRRELLMLKVPFAGEYHCDAGIVGGGNDFVVFF